MIQWQPEIVKEAACGGLDALFLSSALVACGYWWVEVKEKATLKSETAHMPSVKAAEINGKCRETSIGFDRWVCSTRRGCSKTWLLTSNSQSF